MVQFVKYVVEFLTHISAVETKFKLVFRFKKTYYYVLDIATLTTSRSLAIRSCSFPDGQ